jgi:hypothetical protein
MGLFNRRKPAIQTDVPPNQDNRVEVVVHKNATKEAVEKAKATNQHLQSLLDANGFTLKIYLAAGGKHPDNTKRSK